MALEPAYARHLLVVPPVAWDENQQPLAEYLEQFDPEGTQRRVPFLWVVDADGMLQRAIVTRELALASRDRLRGWRVLQELARLPERLRRARGGRRARAGTGRSRGADCRAGAGPRRRAGTRAQRGGPRVDGEAGRGADQPGRDPGHGRARGCAARPAPPAESRRRSPKSPRQPKRSRRRRRSPSTSPTSIHRSAPAATSAPTSTPSSSTTTRRSRRTSRTPQPAASQSWSRPPSCARPTVFTPASRATATPPPRRS